MNYFQLFELPFSPIIDKTFVAKKYFELQKKYHPDFFTQASEEEKEDMMQQSAEINKAYKIFQKKEKTIEYFLQQKGVITADEKYALPPDFLMEMMELNEALTEEDEASFKKKVEAFETSLEESVAPILSNVQEATITDEQLQVLKDFYFKKKYLNRILDRLND